MTNASSQKRPWEGGSEDGVKRKRELSPAAASKDWRDVYLKERDSDQDRDRDRRRRRDDDHYSGGRRERDYHGRDRSRRSRERRYHRDGDDGLDQPSRVGSRSPARGVPPSGPAGSVDDEKEEGEISPAAIPQPVKRSPPAPPAARHRHDKREPDRSRDHRRDGKGHHRSPRSRSRSPKPAKHTAAPPSPSKPDAPVPKVEEAPVVEETIPSPPQKSEEEILAEKRARRAAIKAKYEASKNADTAPGTPNSATTPALGTPSGIVNETLARVSLGDRSTPTASAGTPQRASITPPPTSTPGQQFELAKGDDTESTNVVDNAAGTAGPEQQINAADYDPSLDRREDERRRFGIENGNAPVPDVMDVDADEDEEGEETEEEDQDLDDMFAVALDECEAKPKKKKANGKPKKAKPRPNSGAVLATANLVVDSAADPEGYYQIILGERLDNGRYQVFSSLGKGMFANVIRARVLKDETGKDLSVEGSGEPPKEVAIKIIRCQESMYKAGVKEAQILQKLRALDPEDKKHLVRLERTFEHRGHLCLVFENLSMNLREVVKRFGKDVGLNIRAVRAYAHQLFIALSLLKKANIMHADIKPDNILVNEQKTVLKLCDLGSASDANENDITPYLVSRFYRAPEIILGVPYDPALDVWSIGCTLYELYTGKILFPGRSNNQMLRLMMELKGRFNGKMIKKAKFGETYFDELGGFESIETDKLTGNDVSRRIHIQQPTRDLRARLLPSNAVKLNDEEHKMLLNFVDLLEKCLMLDPARRITPREALAHPFIRA